MEITRSIFRGLVIRRTIRFRDSIRGATLTSLPLAHITRMARDFLYILTSDLPLDDEADGNCLKKAVRYHTGNIRWTTSLEKILGLESVETAVSTGEVTLDRYIQ